MSAIHVFAERIVDAPAEKVYGYLADMREHPRFLPPAFSDFVVESGGIGGIFARLFAPRVMRAIYADELDRLNAYARDHAAEPAQP